MVENYEGGSMMFTVADAELRYLILRGWTVAEILHAELGVINFDPNDNDIEEADRLVLRLEKVA